MSLPDTTDLALGRGIIYEDEWDPDNEVYLGERDMGNATNVAVSIEVETLPHDNYRSGFKNVDLEPTISTKPTMSLTLDTVTMENKALFHYGSVETIAQAAGNVVDTLIARLDRYVALSKRNIGLYKLTIDNIVGGPFQVGEIVNQSTPSAASGKVMIVGATYLYIQAKTGTFVDDSQITGATSSATADVDGGDAVFEAGKVGMSNSAGDTWYTDGTDFSVNLTIYDHKIGRVFFPETSSIADAAEVKVYFDYEAVNYKRLNALSVTNREAKYRFVSNNPVGKNGQFKIHRGSIAPDGEQALVGDGWSSVSLVITMLKDESQPAGVSQYYVAEEF